MDTHFKKDLYSQKQSSNTAPLNVVDLFSGVGGFHYGISQSATKLGKSIKSLLACEIDPNCQSTYQKNLKCEVQGDINKLELSNFRGEADITTAGFPCQPFSNSGRKEGLSDPRGQFYHKIEEIIKYFNSKSFILENVSGIRTNGGGNYNSSLATNPQKIGQAMKFLEDNLIKLKDYSIKWTELDSSLLGSPQVRKRVYIIGVHKDLCEDLSLLIKPSPFQKNNFITIAEETIQKNLEVSKTQEKNLRSFMNKPPSFKDGMRRVGKAYLCPGGNVGQGYHAYGLVPTLTKVWARFLPIYFPHEKENLPEIGSKEFKPNEYYGKGYIRRASVREAYRLQGFPETFTPHMNNKVAYEQAGNAVNVKVVEIITDQILKRILK